MKKQKKRGKKPQPKIEVAEGWWNRLVNFCQANNLGKNHGEIYRSTTISRRTFGNAQKSNEFTEGVFDTLVAKLGCKNRDELRRILGPKPISSSVSQKSGKEIFGDSGLEKSLSEFGDSPSKLQKISSESNSEFAEDSLAHFIQTLPIPSLISHFLSILESPQNIKVLGKLMDDLESPVNIHAMAKKLSGETIDNFFLFYRDAIEPLEPFKKRVAEDLGVNLALRKKLAVTVARAGFRDMLAWFSVFSRFCDHVIILDVEQELIVVSKEADFKSKFIIFAPERLPQLMEYFSRHGCVVAFRILEEINEEAKVEESNKSAPKALTRPPSPRPQTKLPK